MECRAPLPADNIASGDAGIAVAHGGRTTPGPEGPVAPDANVDPVALLGALVRKYGDTVRYDTKFGPCFLFVHPADVETILHRENFRRAALTKMMLGDGLLSSDGPIWKSQRRLMQGDFVRTSITRFAPLFARRTSQTGEKWRAAAETGATVDVTAAMTELTLRIIVDALFSDDLNDVQTIQLCDAVSDSLGVLGNLSRTVFGIPVSLSPEDTKLLASARTVFDAACFEMISRRRSMKPAERPEDLLTLLIESEDETDSQCNRRLRDQIVTMLVSGHETTGLALSWTWKLLAEHPMAESTLHEEVDDVLQGRIPDLSDVPRLTYTTAVIHEAMRLYPPVWNIVRVADHADVVGGHAIPRGACVSVSPWFTHRHPEFWPQPERFDPTRFLGAQQRHRYAFFPFGGGRHQCIGMYLAMLEATMLLAQLAQQFCVRPVASESARPNLGLTLRQIPHLEARIKTRFAKAAIGALHGEEP